MPPGEISVTCPGCSYKLQAPISAIRRNNMYCPQCGKSIPLAGMQTSAEDGVSTARPKPKRSSRPAKRR